MFVHEVPARKTFCIFLVLFATFRLPFGTTSVCPDATSGSRGTVFLLLNSSTKRVSLPQSDGVLQEDRGTWLKKAEVPLVLQQMPRSRSYSSEAARLQALGSLEYDSDDDDGRSVYESALELADDQESENTFHKYVESKGYNERADVSFSPAVWNSAPEVRGSHNCYMYALNDLSPRSGERCKQTRELSKNGRLVAKKKEVHKVCKRYFHKPGYYFQNYVSGRAETDVWFRNETTCKLMLPMIASDSPAIVWKNQENTTLTEADSCPESHYMAALFIQPQAGFHFYRRDHPCRDDAEKLCWSHKPGITEATDKDASGSPIKSVLQADRNYGDLNYSQLCALFCVPQNSQERTHSDSRRS